MRAGEDGFRASFLDEGVDAVLPPEGDNRALDRPKHVDKHDDRDRQYDMARVSHADSPKVPIMAITTTTKVPIADTIGRDIVSLLHRPNMMAVPAAAIDRLQLLSIKAPLRRSTGMCPERRAWRPTESLQAGRRLAV